MNLLEYLPRQWGVRLSNGNRANRSTGLYVALLAVLTACSIPSMAHDATSAATGDLLRLNRPQLHEPAVKIARNGDFEDPFAREDPLSPPRAPSLADPVKPVNQATFTFNDRFYFWLLKPGNRAYETVTSPSVRQNVRNFFQNIQEPRNFVNALMQGEWRDAHDAFGRFVFNSTFGIGGLFDVMKKDLPPVDRSFDQTLAKAGVPPGIYLIWPVTGPSSVRGTVGLVADWVMDPLTWPFGVEDTTVALGATSLRTVNEVSFTGSAYEDLQRYSVDPYNGLKNFYENRIAKRARE